MGTLHQEHEMLTRNNFVQHTLYEVIRQNIEGLALHCIVLNNDVLLDTVLQIGGQVDSALRCLNHIAFYRALLRILPSPYPLLGILNRIAGDLELLRIADPNRCRAFNRTLGAHLDLIAVNSNIADGLRRTYLNRCIIASFAIDRIVANRIVGAVYTNARVHVRSQLAAVLAFVIVVVQVRIRNPVILNGDPLRIYLNGSLGIIIECIRITSYNVCYTKLLRRNARRMGAFVC